MLQKQRHIHRKRWPSNFKILLAYKINDETYLTYRKSRAQKGGEGSKRSRRANPAFLLFVENKASPDHFRF